MSQCTALSFVPPVSGIGAAEREVDRAADLLVEQDRADRAVDARVRADPDLAQAAGARVGVQRRQEVLVAAVGARVDDDARRGTRARCPATSTPRGLDGIVKRMRPFGGVLDRAGEDLARGHVAPAVGVDPRAAADAQPQVRALGLDAQLARARPAARRARAWQALQLAPGGDRGRRGRGTSRARRRPRTRRCPSAPAARAAGVGQSVEHQRRRIAGLADRRPGAGGARHPGGVDAGERGRVLRRLDRHRRVGLLRLGQVGGRERRRGARRARRPTSPRPRPAASVRSSGHAPRLEDLAPGARAAAARRASWSARRPAGRAAPPGSSPQSSRAKRAASTLTAPPRPGTTPRGARAARRGSSGARPPTRTGSGRAAPSA